MNINKSSKSDTNQERFYYKVSTFDSLLHIILYNLGLGKDPTEVGLAISALPLSDKLHGKPVHLNSTFEKSYIRLNKISKTQFIESLYSKWNLVNRHNEPVTMNSLSSLILSQEIYSVNLTSALIKLELGEEFPNSNILSGVLYADLSSLAYQASIINQGYTCTKPN